MNTNISKLIGKTIAISFTMICLLTAFSCKDEPLTPPINIDEVSIVSLIAEDTVLNAWQTTSVNVIAEGDSLEYYWEADHGELNGSGSEVQYMAGTCCTGINTITCTVSNQISSKNEQISVRVLPF